MVSAGGTNVFTATGLSRIAEAAVAGAAAAVAGAGAGAGAGALTSRSCPRSSARGDLVRRGAGHPRGGRHRGRRGVTVGHRGSNSAAGAIRLCGDALRREGAFTAEEG